MRIDEILGRLGFPLKKLSEPVENLSRGMQQKIAITRALLSSPKLLLLDEPTTGLDPRSKRQVQSLMRELNVAEGITAILTTHDMDEAENLCRRLLIMKDGEVVASGTPEELKAAAQGAGTLEDVFLRIAEEEEGENCVEP